MNAELMIPDKFLDIWKLAKPYYLKGRSMDIDHIEWMMRDALYVSKKEKLDNTLLLPLIILHDVGYAEVAKGDYYNLDLRRGHMKAGAVIAKRILEELGYPKDQLEKIVYYVSVHDNWAFGEMDLYRNDKILGVFKDLDWLWTLTEKGFPAVKEIKKCTTQEMIAYVSNPKTKVPPEYFTRTTGELFQKYLSQRKKEYLHSLI